MKLEGFGIRLEILTPESAEIVRRWRNQPEILSQMEYQEMISEKAQQQWFEQIKNDIACLYFLILSNDQAAGMIHLAAIDPKSKTAEAGLFIGNHSFSGTGIALGASLLVLDYAFNALKLENIKAKVKNTNTVAQQYNQLLGFKNENQLNENFTQFELSRETYLYKREKLVKLIAF